MKKILFLILFSIIICLSDSYGYSKVDSLENIILQGSDVQKSYAYFELAETAFHKKDFTNAMKSYVESMRIADNLKDRKLVGKTRLAVGLIYFSQKDDGNALTNFTKSLEYFKEINDNEGIAEANKCLGDFYVQKKIYGKAKDHYRAAMDIWVASGQQQKAADIAAFLGNVVSELADYEGALTYYQNSLDLNGSINNLPNIARDMTSIAKIHVQQSNFDQAKTMVQSATDIRTNQGDNLGLAELHTISADIAASSGSKANAETELKLATDLLSNTPVVNGTDRIYLSISEIYKKLGNSELAYKYALNFADAKEKIFNLEQSKAMMELTTRYESEFENNKQQAKIVELEQQKAASRTKLWFLFGLLALAGALAYKFYQSAQQKKKANEVLVQKNTLIEEQKSIVHAQNIELGDKNDALDTLNIKLVSEIGKREMVEQNTFARDSFLAAVTAQMRTPINHISGLTHLLLENNPRAEQFEQLRALQFSSNDLVVFINDILDYSKIEAGKINVESRVFSAPKIFTEIKNRFDHTLKIKNVDFDFESINVPETLVGDPSRLNQILSNLLHNASTHTEKGMIKTTIEFMPQNGVDSHIRMSIRDTGTGLNQDEVNMLQQKFSSDDEHWYGTNERALKLAIAKRLIELQNGTFEVRTNQGEGTLVYVTIPFKVAEKQALINENSLFDERKLKLKNKRILLIEDNKINQLVVTKMLQKDGIIVSTADDGQIGLDRLKAETFDLILMDIQMPNMDGYRATAEIRRLQDATRKDIPIIALTASVYLTEKEKAELFGMNDYIGKPFSPEELLEKILKVLV